jgi:hypothetical protein
MWGSKTCPQDVRREFFLKEAILKIEKGIA